MQIAVLSLISLLLAAVAWVYLSFGSLKEQGVSIKNIANVFLAHKKKAIYIIVVFFVLLIFSTFLPIVYESNLLIHNVKMIVLLATLFIAAFVDYQKHIIPNKVILAALVLRCVLYILELFTSISTFWTLIKGDLIACLIVVVFFVLGVLVMKNGLGMGDIKLMLVMCLYQGFYGVISSIFISLIVAFILSIALLITRKKNKKDAIAFAPSILIGTTISVFLTGM